jgi:flagellar M-ring protein FliF
MSRGTPAHRRVGEAMETLRSFVRTLGAVRLAVLGGVTLALIGFFVWIIARASAPQQALLYSDLDMADAARVVSQLEVSAIPYRLGNGGTSVYVAADQVARTRLALAEQGLPSGGSVGYEIFDAGESLGTTNFQQNVNLVRALEGELARTIRSIDTVKAARVHLVLPRREVFSREKPEASASVLLQMRGRTRLTPAQVVAVQHLIASAVSGLTPSRISIVDAQGTLLTEGTDGTDAVALAAGKVDQRRRELENHLSRTAEQLLERIVGAGKVRAEVSADIDFDRVNTSEEIFDPDGQVVRSTQSVEQKGTNTDGRGGAPVSVAGSLPDANLAPAGPVPGSSSSENRTEETVNYEISKKVVNHVREAGLIKRLSVAVLVDGTYETAADGTREYRPRSSEELEQLTGLVRGAVGFDAQRGDKVDVVSMRFADAETLDEAQPELLLGLEKNDLLRVGEYLALLVLATLVLLLVIKPIVAKAIDARPTPAAGSRAESLPGQTAMPALTAPESEVVGAISRSLDDTHPDEMIDIDRVEGRVRASTVKRVSEIVDKHPEESLAIVRSWLHSEP